MASLGEAFDFFVMNNTLSSYLTASVIFLGLFVLFFVFDRYLVYVLKRASTKTKTTWDDVVIDFVEGITLPFFVYVSFYIGAITLVLPVFVRSILDFLLVLFIVFYAARAVINIASHGLDRYKESRKKKKKATSESMIGVMKIIAKVVIWTIALLLFLGNLGVEITPLIASLGIGGIAVGLALQSILGDLFSAFAIYFDKPFEEGDFIIIGSDMGVIKHIGIKSTRIQALGGQELVVSNSELTSTRINNYKKMQLRRVVFSFGVEYKTSGAQLKKIKKIVEEIITKTPRARLDRVHFKAFGDSSLDFEVVYYIDSNDYNLYMDTQEKINLSIKERVEKLGVGFAFPSRTVYLERA